MQNVLLTSPTKNSTTVGGAATPDDGVLEWAASIVLPELQSVVEGLPPSVRHAASYHFGWRDANGQPTSCSPGKLLRPALTLLCAQAVGSPADHALDAAVALELVHNFSLLHDDVMDGDVERRHRPTVWAVYGVPMAILLGDALLVAAFETVAHATGSVALLASALWELTEGQGQDLAFERRRDVSVDECLAMAGGKTAALLRCAAELGARHGGGSPTQVQALARFGWHVGLAFQLCDDVLGIWGDPRSTGKPAMSDLRAGKKSLPVVAALATDGPAAGALAERYLRPAGLGDDEIPVVAALVEQAGGRSWAELETERQVDAALTSLAAASPSGSVRGDLTWLAHTAGRRDL